IHITSRLHSRVPLDTELATNLPSRFAGSITASFIGPVMKQDGGKSSTSIHFQSHSGSGSIVKPIASAPGRNCLTDRVDPDAAAIEIGVLTFVMWLPAISVSSRTYLERSGCFRRSGVPRDKAACRCKVDTRPGLRDCDETKEI